MMKRVGLIAALVAAHAATVPAVAQERPGPVTLTTHPLRGGAYWVEGGRSNDGFIVGKTGVIVFDAQMTPEGAKQELAAIAAITPLPVNQIIVSHADPDHVAGLPNYPAGTPIIAHENAKSEIVAAAADSRGGPTSALSACRSRRSQRANRGRSTAFPCN